MVTFFRGHVDDGSSLAPTVPGHRRPVADAGILGLPRDGTPQFPVAQARWALGAIGPWNDWIQIPSYPHSWLNHHDLHKNGCIFSQNLKKSRDRLNNLRDNCLRLPLNQLRDRIEAIRIANMPSCFANFVSFFSELEIVHNLWRLSPWLYPVYPLDPIGTPDPTAGWLPTSRRSIAARKTWSTWQGSPGLRGFGGFEVGSSQMEMIEI